MSERLYYRCNQCGAIHEAGVRPELCRRLAAITNALVLMGLPGIPAEDRREIERMARTDEETRR